MNYSSLDREATDKLLNSVMEKEINEMLVLAKYNYPPAQVLLKRGLYSIPEVRMVGRVVTHIMNLNGYSVTNKHTGSDWGSGRRITLSLYIKDRED